MVDFLDPVKIDKSNHYNSATVYSVLTIYTRHMHVI